MGSSRLRILHVIQNLNYGGMERLLADIVTRTAAHGFENHVLVLQYLGRFAKGLAPHATLHTAGRLPSWTMFWPGPLARQIRTIAPDVVHLHSGVWYKASLAARMARVPRVLHTEHGRRSPDPWLFRILDGFASRRTDTVVAVSDPLAEHLKRSVVRGRAPVVVVTNGVDTRAFAPRPESGRIRAELGIPGNEPVLGSIGRLEPIKGYDVMIHAFARLLEQIPSGQPSPHLVVAGDGSQREHLEHLIRTSGMTGRLHLLGWRDDVHELLSTFVLFTMSSRSEGTSVSLLEAMSSGLCPVVTRVGGNEGVLGRELGHRLVDPENPELLAGAWATALSNPGARCRDASLARQRVEQAFSLDEMVRQYERLYRARERGPG